MISLQEVNCRAGGQALLTNVSLSLAPACIAIIGPNGAGKSSLLHLCADGGRSRPDLHISGSLRLDEQPLRELAPATLARRRAFLPQQHADSLPLPVAAILDLAAWPHEGQLPATLRALAVTQWELAPLLSRSYAALSGGERQRVQLARTWLQMHQHALAEERIWLLDEPQGALDLPHQQTLLASLRQEADTGALVIFSTHDINFALRAADRILALKDGQVVADGTPDDLSDPERLRQVFGVGFVRVPHPGDGRPLLLPH